VRQEGREKEVLRYQRYHQNGSANDDICGSAYDDRAVYGTAYNKWAICGCPNPNWFVIHVTNIWLPTKSNVPIDNVFICHPCTENTYWQLAYNW